jgi:hypothetical protein
MLDGIQSDPMLVVMVVVAIGVGYALGSIEPTLCEPWRSAQALDTGDQIPPQTCMSAQALSNPIQSNPIQSNPIQSNPIQSNPIQSNPIQSNPMADDVLCVDTDSTFAASISH